MNGDYEFLKVYIVVNADAMKQHRIYFVHLRNITVNNLQTMIKLYYFSMYVDGYMSE